MQPVAAEHDFEKQAHHGPAMRHAEIYGDHVCAPELHRFCNPYGSHPIGTLRIAAAYRERLML